MKRPYTDDHVICIPANEDGILPEYQDPGIALLGARLTHNWGRRGIEGYRKGFSGDPESDLAIVKMVFRRNRKRNPLCMKQHILDVMEVETLAEARGKMRSEMSPRMGFYSLIMGGTFNFYTEGEDVADFYGDEEPDYEKYSQHIFNTL